ncbi:glycosyltransferase family 2 protein [soil metagenome]
MQKLSIIILSYNTKEITHKCLSSLVESITPFQDLQFEIIAVDNASSDGSAEMLRKFQESASKTNLSVKVILSPTNEGFPKGNNRGVKQSSGNYIVFLNSDVIVSNLNWQDLIDYLEKEVRIGVLTVKVNLPTNGIDPASHRGFPTIWNSFCYYAGLEKLTRYIPALATQFGGYHLTQYSVESVHEIDSPSGAFYLIRRSIFEDLGGFDEEFFMYGEDLDLSYRVKQNGFTIMYYPKYMVLHLKHQSGLKKNKTSVRSKTKQYFYDAMRIFYRKHYASQHSSIVNNLIYTFIDIKAKL